jgi:hypothetical protein
MSQDPQRVRPRQNVATSKRASFRKRNEVVAYWVLLGIVLMLVIWFLSSAAVDRGNSDDAEATVIATLFVPETATAEAEDALDAP